MSYRHRMQLRNDRRQARNTEEREDRVMFAEPHLRDYEAAHLAYYGQAVQGEYKGGYCVFTGGVYVTKYRLQAMIAKTHDLQTKVHERNTREG